MDTRQADDRQLKGQHWLVWLDAVLAERQAEREAAAFEWDFLLGCVTVTLVPDADRDNGEGVWPAELWRDEGVSHAG